MVIVPDISFWQDNDTTARKVDFSRMRAAGASGVIIRAGQNRWVDEDFADYWRDAKAAGLARGTYWFWDSRVPPVAQADLWKSAVGGDLPELGAWCDFEEGYLGSYGTQGHMRDFIERVKVLFPTSVEVGVYTGPAWWRSRVGALVYWAQYPLWIAHYGVASPTVPAPWQSWTLWQYTDHGDGLAYGVESREIDLNYFNGSEERFRSFFGLGGVPVPPIGEPMPTVFKTKDDMCRVYNDRGAESAPAITQAGTVLTVTGPRVSVPNRGLCWPISAPRVGFVLESEVVVSGTVTPPPPPPPDPEPAPDHVVEVFIDGVSVFRKELFTP